ncbi:MAG: hypothetical protein PHP64_00775, partial [Actinomycetota bacterium]|nr:hypothetical protein [Actinomycetota bacterium]
MRRAVSFLSVLFLLVLLPFFSLPALAEHSGGSIGSWSLEVSRGFGAGAANTAAGPLVTYNGKLYAGVANEAGARVMVRDGNWKAINTAGFGDSKNADIPRMVVYKGKLYAGTMNQNGCQVWSYDGSTWKEEVGSGAAGTPTGPGFGNASNIVVSAMAVFGSGEGELYVGSVNYRINPVNPGSDGAEIWKFDGTNWGNVVTGGFGDTKNIGVTSLCAFGGSLFAGTARCEATVTPVGLLKVKVEITSKGCELRKLSGSNWVPVGGNGITDTKNIALVAMEEHGGSLFLGTTNGDPSFVVDLSNPSAIGISDLTYSTNGLCIYRYVGGSVIEEIAKGGIKSKDEFTVSGFVSYSVEPSRLLIGVSKTSGPASLYVYDGEEFFLGADDGFGNTNNVAISGLEAYGGYGVVYVGTTNDKEGCEVWHGSPPEKEESTMRDWYLAEGSTDGFETWILVQNPGKKDVTAQITYMTPSGEKTGPMLSLPPRSRCTVDVSGTLPGEASVSTRVEATDAVIAERAMYLNGRTAGHDSIGTTTPSTTWYLAEGSTEGFETWILVQNPQGEKTTAHITYMTPTGEKKGPDIELPPNSRKTVDVSGTV